MGNLGRTLVVGGTLVSATSRRRADVLIEDGAVVAVGEVDGAGATIVEADGCLVLPGGVDAHTHVFGAVATDTVSALCGGTTAAISFVDAEPGETPAEAAKRTLEEELPASAIDVGFHAVIWEPAAYRTGDLAAVAELGVTSVKLWLAYRELGIMADDAQAFAVMREAAAEGLLVQAHCENGALLDAIRDELVRDGRTELRYHAASRPIALEAEAVHRFLAIAELTDADAYVVHVSGRAPLEEIESARRRGRRAYAEVCPHHLALTDDVYAGPEPARYLMTPPLRTEADRAELWRALAGGALDVYASDHSHLRLADKLRGGDDLTQVAFGLAGIEARLPIGFTLGVEAALISVERLVEVACEAPARIFGLYPRKGALLPGSDADLVVWDPSARWTIRSESLHDGLDYTPYEGIEARGRPRFVLAGGEVVVEEGRYLGRESRASFLPRPRRSAGRTLVS